MKRAFLSTKIGQMIYRLKAPRPFINQASGKISPDNADVVFVAVCGPGFDQRIPNANVTYRLGLCNGFEEIGIPYKLVDVFNLELELSRIKSPICFISGFEYQYMSGPIIKALKKVNHFVWVNFWFKGASDLYKRNHLPNLSCPDWLNKKILSTFPQFVFTPVTESGLQYYENWQKHARKLISLPLACDTSIYNMTKRNNKFVDTELAFVGGYWGYKAKQFDRYLKPYENILTVFGYDKWPYAHYGGMISRTEEAALLNMAKLCPAINEPHAEILGGDICERVYKILGCGGMCITDVSSSHRDIFEEDELLVPANIKEYHEMVQYVLANENLCRSYREKGYKAINSRHTYAHRAVQILEQFGYNYELNDVKKEAKGSL